MHRASYDFENMQTKWGFEEGEAIPPEAEAVRALLIAAINAGQSALEAYAFDRSGMHNWCFLLLRDPKTGHAEAPTARIRDIIGELNEAAFDRPAGRSEVSLAERIAVDVTVDPDAERPVREDFARPRVAPEV